MAGCENGWFTKQHLWRILFITDVYQRNETKINYIYVYSLYQYNKYQAYQCGAEGITETPYVLNNDRQ